VKNSQIMLLTLFYFLQSSSSFFNVVDRVYYQYSGKDHLEEKDSAFRQFYKEFLYNFKTILFALFNQNFTKIVVDVLDDDMTLAEARERAKEIDQSTKCHVASHKNDEPHNHHHIKQSVDASGALKLFVRDPTKHQTYMPDEELAKVEVIS